MKDPTKLRERMVARQIAARGVRSERVLAAMRAVPRERFVPRRQEALAYEDSPLPIGDGQTISQPYIVAYMVEGLDLKGGEKVLEIGTGSGYAAAVLAEMGCEVYTIERLDSLATTAAAVLQELGYTKVHVRHGDGTLGWPEEAPFDGIVVAAAAPDVPEPLKVQLKIGGHLVLPVGRGVGFQMLERITRISETEFVTEDLTAVRFVPLIGEQGWGSERE